MSLIQLAENRWLPDTVIRYGMRRLLREKKPALVIEFHNKDGWSGRRFLFEAGYSLYDVEDGHLLDPVDQQHPVYHCLGLPNN